MAKLKTEIDSPEMSGRIEAAFASTVGEDAEFSVVYEHGQHWIILDTEDGTETYSVVDATGGASIDGFYFERV